MSVCVIKYDELADTQKRENKGKARKGLGKN